MKTIVSNYPLVKLPASDQLTLSLIREELKSRKLFRALHAAGIDDCYYQPHLDSIILRNLGLDDSSDETFDRYTTIMNKRAKKIEPDKESIMKQAVKAWHELTALGIGH